LLDFFVHPALFWCFGRAQAEQHIHDDETGDELDEEIVLHSKTVAHGAPITATSIFASSSTEQLDTTKDVKN
jgi:hypothetical protein